MVSYESSPRSRPTTPKGYLPKEAPHKDPSMSSVTVGTTGGDIRFKMPEWYYDKKALKKTPSYLQGISGETEQRYRREGARFILKIGTKLNLKCDTIATGIVYFHRFYMFHSFKTFPRFVTGCCCLFLAGKVEETPKKCKQIINAATSFLTAKQKATFGDDPKEEVMTMERILLKTIKFDLQVQHPYCFLLKYAKAIIAERRSVSKLVQMAWTFINDSLCTTLCLQWEPEIIAIAVIYLAGKLSQFEINDWQGRTPDQKLWWEAFASGINVQFLEDICHEILDLYSTPNPDTPQDSPVVTPTASPRRPSRPPSPPMVPTPGKTKEIKSKCDDIQPIPTLDQSKKLQAPPLPPMAMNVVSSATPPLPKDPIPFLAPPPTEPPPTEPSANHRPSATQIAHHQVPASNHSATTQPIMMLPSVMVMGGPPKPAAPPLPLSHHIPPPPPHHPPAIHPTNSIQVGPSAAGYTHPGVHPPPAASVPGAASNSTYPQYYMVPEGYYYNNGSTTRAAAPPPPPPTAGHHPPPPTAVHHPHPPSAPHQIPSSRHIPQNPPGPGPMRNEHYPRTSSHPYLRPSSNSNSGSSHYGSMMLQQRR